MRKSTTLAWGAMLLMVAVIIIAICTRVVSSIWEYSMLFLAFMAVFCHLAALLLYKMSAAASKKLDVASMIFGFLAVVALIVVFILDWNAFY